jgi:hypothetical protein
MGVKPYHPGSGHMASVAVAFIDVLLSYWVDLYSWVRLPCASHFPAATKERTHKLFEVNNLPKYI